MHESIVICKEESVWALFQHFYHEIHAVLKSSPIRHL